MEEKPELTDEERGLLAALATRPNGGIVREESAKRLLNAMLFDGRGFVSDVYETPTGGLTGRVTQAGRDALTREV